MIKSLSLFEKEKNLLGVKADFTLNVVIDNHPVSFFVHKRPHVDYFLETVSKWFDLVVFTASMEVYGKGNQFQRFGDKFS